MLKIRFYRDEDYLWVKETLIEWDLFDKVWETKENLSNKIKRDPESILVAEEDSQVVGCIFIMEDWRNAFIWRLAVRKDFRKKGIWWILMNKAEEIIKSRWSKEIGWFVDSKKNDLKERYKKQNYTIGSNFDFIYKNLD